MGAKSRDDTVTDKKGVILEPDITVSVSADLIPIEPFIVPIDLIITCTLLTVPPTAPFDVQFGSPGAGGVTQSVPIPAGCTAVSCEFNASSSGDPVEIKIWTGSASDTGERFSVFYWNSNDRVAAGAVTDEFTNVDPTGLTGADGFFNGSNVTGLGANNPDIFVITGFDSEDTKTLNVEIAVIGA